MPAPLPPTLTISPSLLVALDRARGAISELVGRAQLLENLDLVTGPLTRREAVLSSRIEGTRTDVQDVLRAHAAAEQPQQDSDLHEVLNYERALGFGQEAIAEGRPLSLTLLRGLHAKLLAGVRGERHHPGALRVTQVFVGSAGMGIEQARYVPPPPAHIPALLEDLFRFIGGEPTYGSIADCAVVHYQFEAIHPFEDGNGRLGRLLIPLILLADGVIDRPVFYISAFFEANRDIYLELLHRVSTRGAWEEWTHFFATAVYTQSNDARERVERVVTLHRRYRERVLAASGSRVAILAIDGVMRDVYVTVRGLANATGSSLPAARDAIALLARIGILAPAEQSGRAPVWVARELLESVYEA